MQMFILKSNLQEAPSAKYQGKKIQQLQTNKKILPPRKKLTSQTITALATFVLELLPSCFLTSKENTLFGIQVPVSLTDFSYLFWEHIL